MKPFACIVPGLLLGCLLSGQAEPWDQAEQRIDRIRRGEVTLLVLDRDGEPLPSALLKVEQRRHHFLFGCNLYLWGRARTDAQNQAYRGRFAEVLNFATLPFYWWSYERKQGVTQADHWMKAAAWCRDVRILPKGHPLAWNYRDPAWLPDDSKDILRLQLERVGSTVRVFSGHIDTWDVVNEITAFDRAGCREQAPNMTAMIKSVGAAAFTRQAFQRARSANPGATLLINDYRMDADYEQVVEGLVDDQGRPLYDVIGLQSHMHNGAWSSDKVWGVCERFRRFGVPLHFTEMTVLSGEPGWERRGPWPSTTEGEARQARELERLYTLLFSHPSVEAITWWDFSDQGAWQHAPAGLLRADMSPKPAYETLKRLVQETWRTRNEVVTGADGRASLRGYFGDYLVTMVMGEQVYSAVYTLKPGTSPTWVFDLRKH